MIKERPGAANDREIVISNIDNTRYFDKRQYDENFDKIYWKKDDINIKLDKS